MRFFVPRLLLGACLLSCSGWALPNSTTTSAHAEREKAWTKYVEIAGATSVGSSTCIACHEETSRNFQHAFHKQQGVECEDCHGNVSLHVEGGGDVTKIVSFRKRVAEAANGVCLSCHSRNEKIRHWTAGSHSANHLRCIDCHQIHSRALQTT